MTFFRVGDVFQSDAGIICHQVNCKGVMGAGIAITVKKNISKQNFFKYVDLCDEYGSGMLGKVLYTPTLDGKKIIANCFGQDGYGGKATVYPALESALQQVATKAKKTGTSIALPGLIGCGLAGGDWEFVRDNIIYPIFEKENVDLDIYYFSRNLYEKNHGKY